MITIKLNENQQQGLRGMLDLAVKKNGMEYYTKAALLLTTLNNPTESDGELIYSFSENQLNILNELFDISLKEDGLAAYSMVFVLSTHFQQAINEQQEEETRLAESVEE